MTHFLTLLILASFGVPATRLLSGPEGQQRHPDAVEVFHCDFVRRHDVDLTWDENFDAWPDKWSRVYGTGLPRYVIAGIEDDASAVGGKQLTVRLNGGGAEVTGPAVGVSDMFSYTFEARIRAEKLRSGRAQVRVEFCDENREVLQTASSAWFSRTEGWATIRLPPINPTSEAVRLARVVLHVDAGSKADLEGSVSLDDLWLARLPKLVVRTNSPFNVYEDPHDVVVTCELSGILEKNPDILFELLDASSQKLDSNQERLEGRLITERLSHASDIVDSVQRQKAGYAGSTSWRPPIVEHGYYRVRVTMKTSAGTLKQEVISIAVAPPLDRAPRGEFGWSLAGDPIPLTFDELGDLLPRVAVNWLKLPVWYDPNQTGVGDRIVSFTEQLAAKDIEVVGVVDDPPPNSELARRQQRKMVVADTLSADTSAWLPSLDPVLTRLSLRVRWWQLGDDHDSSFSALPHLEEEIAKLRSQLFRFGQDVSLGIGWNWTNMATSDAKATWDFQQFSAEPPLTGSEIASYLQLPRREGAQRWVLIEPLSRKQYDLETRARDLLEQVLAAKIYKADAIFASRPFDDEQGLMSDAGAPGDLLLPWRTTASLLGGASFLGSIELPHASHNRVFQTPDGNVIMVIWSDRHTREVIHLGDQVRVVDVWGRTRTPPKKGNLQVIEVDRLPVFVRGLNPHITRWHMATDFAEPNIPSVFGKTHANQLHFVNEFPQGIGGTARLTAPEGWQVSPDRIEFKLAGGEKLARTFDLALPFDANTGKVPIRIDFDIVADKGHKFSVYRQLAVGDGDVEVDIHTRLEKNGDLVVEQRMTNQSNRPLDFKCLLYSLGALATDDAPAVPQRRRQRSQVFRLGAAADVKTYRYPHGEELLGTKMWLRVEELEGSRVMNFRFDVER